MQLASNGREKEERKNFSSEKMEIASQMSELTILRKEEEEKEVRPKSCKQGMGRRRWTRWQNGE